MSSTGFLVHFEGQLGFKTRLIFLLALLLCPGDELHIQAGVQSAVVSIYLSSHVVGYFDIPEIEIILQISSLVQALSCATGDLTFCGVEVVLEEVPDNFHVVHGFLASAAH